MSVATSTAIGIAGAIGAVGAVGSAAMSSSAAGKAASTQAQAADYAAQLQHQDAQAALAFQQQVYGQQQQNIAPWLTTGRAGLQSLASLMGINVPNSTFSGAPTPAGGPGFNATGNNPPGNLSLQDLQGLGGGPRGGPNSELMRGGRFNTWGPSSNLRYANENGPSTSAAQGPLKFDGSSALRGITAGVGAAATATPTTGPGSPGFGSLTTPWTEQFQAPTAVTEQNDPGYQFRLNEGEKALQASAAARGNLFSGGTQKDLQGFAQDYASNEYGNVYNRALGQFQQRYNIFENNQSNIFNRYATLAGVGQTAANQLNSAGSDAASRVANINLTSGAQIGANINNAGAARASGYVGGANAWSGALGTIGGLPSNLYTLSQLAKMSGGSNPYADPNPYAVPGSVPGAGTFGEGATYIP